MVEVVNPRFYYLSFIPANRQQYIDVKVNWFINAYGLTMADWPLDCVKLLSVMKEKQKIPFTFGSGILPPNCDALAEYYEDEDINVLLYNKDKFRYPFCSSMDRRFNFTIAHEIAHIVLEHLTIPGKLKTQKEKFIEEQEANEFAGRLLMPKKLILNCNFISFEAVSKYFNVSNSALWMRLNNLQSLNMMYSRKIPVCNVCGNAEMHYVAKYCKICGNILENNLDGVQKVHYTDGIMVNNHGEALQCPSCNGEETDWLTGECLKCGIPLTNYCSKGIESQLRLCSFSNSGNARYCEMCGSKTYFYNMGFLKPWYDV